MIRTLILLFSLVASPVVAQEHSHPPQDQALHEKFYSTWYMPDDPTKSCCSSMDCAPAQSRFVNGHWEAKRDRDANWIKIPAAKVERNRDNPDGRSHLCASWGDAPIPYCFSAGSGT